MYVPGHFMGDWWWFIIAWVICYFNPFPLLERLLALYVASYQVKWPSTWPLD